MYVDPYIWHPKPYVWTASAEAIVGTVSSGSSGLATLPLEPSRIDMGGSIRVIEPQGGPIPRLYRFFDVEKHADDFVQGMVCISTIQRVREIEGPVRGDPQEGTEDHFIGHLEGHGSDPEFRAAAARLGFMITPEHGQVVIKDSIYTRSITDAYLLCFALEDGPRFRKEFGPYVVETADPQALYRRLTGVIASHRTLKQCRFDRVSYDARVFTASNPAPAPDGLGFRKKMDPYGWQAEARMIWLGDGSYAFRQTVVGVGELKGICRRVA